MKLPPNPHFCRPTASRARWSTTFGRTVPGRLRWRRPLPGDKWYPDELLILLQGVQHYAACGRSGRCRAPHPCSATVGRQRREAFLSTVAEKFSTSAAGSREGQTAQLWRGSAHDASERRTSTKRISEQSCGEVRPSDTPPDSTVQTCWSGPGSSLRTRIHRGAFPSTTPSRSYDTSCGPEPRVMCAPGPSAIRAARR